jgi:hypothetical protein
MKPLSNCNAITYGDACRRLLPGKEFAYTWRAQLTSEGQTDGFIFYLERDRDDELPSQRG